MTNINERFIISVAKLMENESLPKPKHKSKFIYNDGEFLPIITVEVEI
ncbi:hypothetical protein [Methanobrevibacter sp. V14]|nr:hypothetical protein [Methanobrevibacter sp. V14]